MSRRSRRHSRSSRHVSGPGPSFVPGLSVPRSLFFHAKPVLESTGRRQWRPPSLSTLMLPRSETPVLDGQRRLNDLRSFLAVLRTPRQPNRLPVAVYRALGREARRELLRAPQMPPYRTPCARRGVRREVMFARQVAGRRWGAGGPDMRNARRTVESQYSC